MGLLALLLANIATAASPVANRYAVLIAADAGDPQEPALQYATRDATELATTLKQMGGFPEDHVWVLRHPVPQDIVLTLAQVQALIQSEQQNSRESLLFVYYAGYADPQAMHLSTLRMRWPELIAATRKTRAAARVLVVDACRSSGRINEPPSYLDRIRQPETLGELAIFSAISADEHSRESDAVGGALFTHHLLDALQGAGDADGDGKVTLYEALNYSAARSVRGYEPPAGGEENANVSYRLHGHGRVALTQPIAAAGMATMHLAAPGTYVIRQDSAVGPVAAQAVVDAAVRTLWLPPGQYYVERRQGHGEYVGTIQLAERSGVMIEEDTFGPEVAAVTTQTTVTGSTVFATPRYALQVGGGLGLARESNSPSPWVGQLMLSRRHEGIVLDLLGQYSVATVRAASASIGARLAGSVGPLTMSAGLRGGGSYLTDPSHGGHSTFGGHLDGVLRGDLLCGERVSIGLEGSVRGMLIPAGYFADQHLPGFAPWLTMQVGVLL